VRLSQARSVVFGRLVHALRVRQGVDQTTFSDVWGKGHPQSWLSQLEMGRRVDTEGMHEDAAKALEITTERFDELLEEVLVLCRARTRPYLQANGFPTPAGGGRDWYDFVLEFGTSQGMPHPVQALITFVDVQVNAVIAEQPPGTIGPNPMERASRLAMWRREMAMSGTRNERRQRAAMSARQPSTGRFTATAPPPERSMPSRPTTTPSRKRGTSTDTAPRTAETKTQDAPTPGPRKRWPWQNSKTTATPESRGSEQDRTGEPDKD
jgi:hypothetical protein